MHHQTSRTRINALHSHKNTWYNLHGIFAGRLVLLGMFIVQFRIVCALSKHNFLIFSFNLVYVYAFSVYGVFVVVKCVYVIVRFSWMLTHNKKKVYSLAFNSTHFIIWVGIGKYLTIICIRWLCICVSILSNIFNPLRYYSEFNVRNEYIQREKNEIFYVEEVLLVRYCIFENCETVRALLLLLCVNVF